jgi:hypothetical protein
MLQELIAEEEETSQQGNANEIGTSETARNTPVQWPTQDLNPVNEYTTEGHITMAFPTLFPYGRADMRDQSLREQEVQIAEYFEACWGPSVEGN